MGIHQTPVALYTGAGGGISLDKRNVATLKGIYGQTFQ